MLGLKFVLLLGLIQIIHSRTLEYNLKITESEDLNLGFENEWTEFKKQNNKRYDISQDKIRYEIFKINYAQIQAHNKLFESGKTSYKMSVNEFTDLTLEDKTTMYSGYAHDKSQPTNQNNEYIPDFDSDIPASIDWRTRNVVSPVKYQGNCASCYSFSAAGSMEGQFAIKHNKLISLSAQNIVDCSNLYGNDGCNGGTMKNSYNYVKGNGGIDTEEMYPYIGKIGKCRYKPNPFPLSSYSSIQYGNETALMYAVANIGPISIAINSPRDFYSYSEGIYYNEECEPQYLNNAALLVGYGVENGTDYWLIKSSFGTKWGLHGYAKLSRNKDNQCGIASDASFPIL